MRLSTRLILVLAVFSLAPVAALGFFAQGQARASLEDTVQAHLESVANLATERIQASLAQDLERVQLVANRQPLVAALQAFVASPNTADRDAMRAALDDAAAPIDAIDAFSVATAQGLVVASSDRGLEGLDVSARPIFQSGLHGPSNSDLRRAPDGSLLIDASGPLVAPSGAVLGVLVGTQHARLLEAVVDDRTGLGATGEVTLARAGPDGSVLYLFPVRFGASNLTVAASDPRSAPTQALAGVNGPLKDALDYRGVAVIASGRLIAPPGWALVAKQDRAEALAPADAIATTIWVALALLAVAVLVLATAAARSLSGPLRAVAREARAIAQANGRSTEEAADEVRDLQQSVRAMTDALLEGKGQLEQRVEQRTSDLRASEERLHEAQAIAQVGSYDVDLVRNAAIVSPEVYRIYGVTEAEAKADPQLLNKAVHPDDQARLAKELADAVARGDRLTADYRIVRKGGEVRHVHLDATAEKGPDGKPTRLKGILQDATERMATERVLRSSQAAAVSANRAKSEFLANMSHEIRTPLNAVLGMGALLEETTLDAGQREMLRTIRSSSSHLLGLLNDVLDLSKIEAGRLELESRPFPLRRTVEEALDVVTPAAHGKGLEIAWRIGPDVPEGVQGDAGRVRQILVNLLGNAVKFTAEGRVELEVSGRAGDLQLAVKDTGIGMTAEELGRLFVPFSQADASIARRFGGTGLGLTICRRLADLMGGTIRVASEPGKGSTFTVRVPLDAAVLPRDQEGSLVALAGHSVVLIDPRPEPRAILGQHLRAWGLDPVAHGAVEAATPLPPPTRCAAILVAAPALEGALLAATAAWLGRVAVPIVVLGPAEAAARLKEKGVAVAQRLDDPVRLSQVHDLLLARAASAPVPLRGPGRPLRILIVEDNRVNQQVLLKMVERGGQTARFASDGLEGVEAVKKDPYDLVFMDVQMPRLDGYEATRRIRTLAVPQPRIVGTTAHAGLDDHRLCLEAGMDAVLTKPLQLRDVERVLNETVPARPPA